MKIGKKGTTISGLISNIMGGGSSNNQTILSGGTVTGGVGVGGQQASLIPAGQRKKQGPPKGWTEIQVEFDPATGDNAILESPVNGREVYIGSLTLSNGPARHHFKLFQRLHPKVKTLVCGIPDHDKANACTVSNIIFLNREDFDTFENWLADYTKLFTDKTALYSHMLPPPPSQMNYSHQIRLGDHEDLLDACVWFRENCVDNVHYLGGRLFFLNDQDAVLYKLKFL